MTISLVIIKALLTTFKQPLASSDTPKHSNHKLRRQRRFTTTPAGLKQSSSLDCLDERSSSQDLVTQSLNISSAASSAAGDGDLLTRSLDSFQGRRSLSSVSINVDSGEKVRILLIGINDHDMHGELIDLIIIKIYKLSSVALKTMVALHTRQSPSKFYYSCF